MSSIKTFKEKYPTPTNELDEKIKEIEAMDISFIKKIDLIQKAKEYERPKYSHDDDDFFGFYDDDFYDQMIIGYGIY